MEIGAGSGLWSRLLSNAGINIIATDLIQDNRSNYGNNYRWKGQFFDVQDKEAIESIKEFGGSSNVLMMVWPPYQSNMASNALRSFSGNKIVFVGECEGGCTANDEFFEELNAHWNLEEIVDIPRWYGIYDNLYLYKRK
mgnify:CR=1 FL=1